MNLRHILSPALFLIVWIGLLPLFGQHASQDVARHSYFSKVQGEQQSFEGFSGFVELFEKGASIPQELIAQYTYLPNTKGSFQADGSFRLKNGVYVLLLQQKTTMCLKQFLLTSDGEKVLHHNLVGERCIAAPGASSNEFSHFSRNSNGEMIQTHYRDVFLPEKDREVLGRLELIVNSRGEIQVMRQ